MATSSGVVDQASRVLAFWRDVEVFDIPPAPRIETQTRPMPGRPGDPELISETRLLESGEALPWELGIPSGSLPANDTPGITASMWACCPRASGCASDRNLSSRAPRGQASSLSFEAFRATTRPCSARGRITPPPRHHPRAASTRSARELSAKVVQIVFDGVEAVLRRFTQKSIQAEPQQARGAHARQAPLPHFIQRPEHPKPPDELVGALRLCVRGQTRGSPVTTVARSVASLQRVPRRAPRDQRGTNPRDQRGTNSRDQRGRHS
jgi:hypothetical protein